MVFGLVPYGGLSNCGLVRLLAIMSIERPATVGMTPVIVALSFVVDSCGVTVVIDALLLITCPAGKSAMIVPTTVIDPVCPGRTCPIVQDVVGVLKSVDGKVSVMTTPLAVLPPAFP